MINFTAKFFSYDIYILFSLGGMGTRSMQPDKKGKNCTFIQFYYKVQSTRRLKVLLSGKFSYVI